MSKELLRGNVSFVNHDKKYIMIEYEQSGKKKVVNGLISEKNTNNNRYFQIGDVVSFTVGISPRGDKMVASNIKYLYNPALDTLINKSNTQNIFTGYLKEVDKKYFVKEIDSYLFFVVPMSPWQIKPLESELNEAVTFKLENISKKDKITAILEKTKYIPEYYEAEKLMKSNAVIPATVYKITVHGIYLNLLSGKLHAKLPYSEGIKVQDVINVKIVYLSPFKLIVEIL